MKKTKKLISIFAALAMVSQVGISAPLVMAENEEEATEVVSQKTKWGLIYTADGVSGDWTVPEDLTVTSSVTYSEEGVTPNYACFTAQGTWNGTNETTPYILAELGDNKIKFEDDKDIVVEAR